MQKNKNQASNKFQKRKHISGQDKRDEFGKKTKDISTIKKEIENYKFEYLA